MKRYPYCLRTPSYLVKPLLANTVYSLHVFIALILPSTNLIVIPPIHSSFHHSTRPPIIHFFFSTPLTFHPPIISIIPLDPINLSSAHLSILPPSNPHPHTFLSVRCCIAATGADEPISDSITFRQNLRWWSTSPAPDHTHATC